MNVCGYVKNIGGINLRVKIDFKLDTSRNKVIPTSYRKNIMSLIKEVLKTTELFEQYFKEGENIVKPFTFSIHFPIEDPVQSEKMIFHQILQLENILLQKNFMT